MSVGTKQSFTEIAENMIKRGVSVVPLHASDKKPLLKEWPKLKTQDLNIINEWAKGHFDTEDGVNSWANNRFSEKNLSVGSVCQPGVGNLCVLDIDSDGVEAEIKAAVGVPETFTVQSRADTAPYKRHFYFWQTEYSCNKFTKTIGSNLVNGRYDLKINGQAVSPGSLHPKTNLPYTIEHDREIITIPDLLVDWIEKDVEKCKPDNEINGTFTPVAKGTLLCAGQRYPYLRQLSVKLRLAGLDSEEIYAKLHKVAIESCDGGESYADSHDDQIRGLSDAAETDFTPDPVVFVSSGKKFTAQWMLASEVKIEKLEWMWPGKLPMKVIVSFVGDPSVAKTTMALDIIARGSTGEKWIDGIDNPIGAFESVLLSAEDDPNTIIVPRLKAAGADLSKIHLPMPVKIGKGESESEREIRLDTDLAMIKELLEYHPAIKLIVIDPISNYCGDKSIMNEQEIRQVLMPIGRMAQEFNVTVIGIFHNSKIQGRSAMHKAIGAIGNVGTGRMGWTFMKDPEDDDIKMMLQMKENFGKFDGIKYTTEEVPVDIEGESVGHARIKYLGTTTVAANTVITSTEDPETKKTATLYKVFGQLLHEGMEPKSQGDLFDASVIMGVSYGENNKNRASYLEKVRKKFGIVQDGKGDSAMWTCPVKAKKVAAEIGTDGDIQITLPPAH